MKLYIALLLLLFCVCGYTYWTEVMQPDTTADLYIQQMGASSNAVAQEVRVWSSLQHYVPTLIFGTYFVVVGLMYMSDIKKFVSKKEVIDAKVGC